MKKFFFFKIKSRLKFTIHQKTDTQHLPFFRSSNGKYHRSVRVEQINEKNAYFWTIKYFFLCSSNGKDDDEEEDPEKKKMLEKLSGKIFFLNLLFINLYSTVLIFKTKNFVYTKIWYKNECLLKISRYFSILHDNITWAVWVQRCEPNPL